MFQDDYEGPLTRKLRQMILGDSNDNDKPRTITSIVLDEGYGSCHIDLTYRRGYNIIFDMNQKENEEFGLYCMHIKPYLQDFVGSEIYMIELYDEPIMLERLSWESGYVFDKDIYEGRCKCACVVVRTSIGNIYLWAWNRNRFGDRSNQEHSFTLTGHDIDREISI